ncbi:hypothetical protein HZH66_012877 [Vespula vulgaris]|uniref:Uncharacterized protein n=1 Tax=Vespula vulgaris TaxID=7454 RepID=A0A834J8T4_VESVU|nr:hypothetical protein HZH66_012877 [Vespula vulgaris]
MNSKLYSMAHKNLLYQANISQTEYERAHREYLKKVQLSQHHGPPQESRKRRRLHVFHGAGDSGSRGGGGDDGDGGYGGGDGDCGGGGGGY